MLGRHSLASLSLLGCTSASSCCGEGYDALCLVVTGGEPHCLQCFSRVHGRGVVVS